MKRKIAFRLRVCRNRFMTVRKDLLYFLGIALVSILALDFYLFKIHNLPATMDILGQIYYKICFAYITGFIFFFLNVHIQNEKAKVKMYLYIHNKIAEILRTNQRFIEMIITASTENVENLRPNLEELKEFCLQVDTQKTCFIPTIPGYFNHWFAAIDYIHKINKDVIDDLFNIRDNISIDVIELLSKIEDTFIIHVNKSNGLPMANQNLEFFHYGIHQYTNYVYALKETFDEKYSRHSWEYSELCRLRKVKGKTEN